MLQIVYKNRKQIVYITGSSGSIPIVVSAVSIAGTAVVNQTLTVSYTITGTPTIITRRWYRGATLIHTSTSSDTYVLTQAEAGNTSNITCNVDADGVSNATSNTIAQILDATWAAQITALSIADSTIIAACNTFIIARKVITATQSKQLRLIVTDKGTNAARLTDFAYNTFNPAKPAIYSGTVTATQADGEQGNGTNGHANTQLNPSIDLTGDFTVCYYTRSTTNNTGATDFGMVASGSNPGLFLGVRKSVNIVSGANANIEAYVGYGAGSIEGFWLLKKSGTTVTIKRNDVVIRTYTAGALSLQNGTILDMAFKLLPSSALGFSDKKYTHRDYIGEALSDVQDTAMYNAVLAKETGLSRNV